ncbi:MAG: hypothetical protein ABIH23_14410, partial [bacterium]
TARDSEGVFIMAILTYRDGRTVYSKQHYTQVKMQKWEEQGFCCADCHFGFAFNRLQFHHYGGRGMNASKRSDLHPRNRMLCHDCHEKARFEHLQDRDLSARRKK